MAEPVQRKISLPAGGQGLNLNKRENMEKVLEKKVEKREVKKVAPRIDPSLIAIERLTVLNGALVEQVKALSGELDDLKNRVDQVAGRLGL